MSQFKIPEDDAVLWRYIDIAELVGLIATPSPTLHFTRLDKFDDRFEGRWPDLTVDSRQARFEDAGMSSDDARVYKQFLRESSEGIRKWVAASCWHRNMTESEAMWRIYVPSGSGVAIRTTAKRLREAVELSSSDGTLGVFEVEYTDDAYVSDSNLYRAVSLKRQSYLHEQEVRAVIWPRSGLNFAQEEPDFAHGIDVNVNDLNLLITHIVVAPGTRGDIRESIEYMARSFDVSADVVPSILDRDPTV